MSEKNISTESILRKLKIKALNTMQEKAISAISSSKEIILLSPTGTGKTLAFLLPLISELKENCNEIQALILVPTRELAIQIEAVIREMGSGYKVNAVYGGRSGSKEKIELKHSPAILVGTPGRVADHIRRERFSTKKISTLILDEFDKSLEIGFKKEMQEIIVELTGVKKKILTSATKDIEIPGFINLKEPIEIDFSNESVSKLKTKIVVSPDKNKLKTLVELLSNIGNKRGVVFCNFKDTIQYVCNYLSDRGISYGIYNGGMEQQDRELTLIKFRNGTYNLIIATDIAARGIDIPELEFIIHYQLPVKEKEFIHRNGRTARMNNKGTAYILKWENENLPDFIREDTEQEKIKKSSIPEQTEWKTIFINGGRRDKISKGDIAGLFFKQGKLQNNELGIIELKQNATYVAVHKSKVDFIINTFNNTRIKKKKVRLSIC